MPDLKVLLHPVICQWTRPWRATAVSAICYCLIKANLHEEEVELNWWKNYVTRTGSVQVITWNEQYEKLTTSDQNGLIIVWMLYKGGYRHEMTNASVIAFGFYTYFCFSYPKVHGTKRWWTTATSQLWPVWDGTPTVKRSALFTKMEWSFWDLWMVNRIDYNSKIKGGKTIRLGISLFPHCGNEYKHVQWDKCLLFIFVGNRLWVKELKGYQLAHVAWSPDSKILLFGMASGEVQIFDNQGNFVVSILVHFAHK